MKKRFLVAYEYGQGAVWAYLLARSASEIRREFPELKVVTRRPSWMSKDDLARIKQRLTLDIDERKASVLARIIEQRKRGSGNARVARG